jgi:hypothetical protein
LVYFYFAAGILSLFFLGYAPVYFLLPGESGFKAGSRTVSGSFFIFFISLFVGSLIAGWVLTLLSLADVSFSRNIIYGTGAVFFAFYVYNLLSARFRSGERKRINRLERDMLWARVSARKRQDDKEDAGRPAKDYYLPGAVQGRKRTPEKRTVRILFIVFIFLIIINFGIVVFLAVLFPVRFWDAISCWSLKGKAFFIDGIINNFYTEHEYSFSQLSYPLYLPLIQTWLLGWMGDVNENLLKLIFPIFYGSLLFTLYYLFRQRIKKLISIILVFIVSLLPVIVDHGYIEYTNLLFSVIMLLAVYFFCLSRKMKGRTGFLALAAVFFAIMSLTRSEGMIYAFIFIMINIFFTLPGIIKGTDRAKNLINLLMPPVLLALFLLPWYLLKIKLGLPLLSEEWYSFLNGVIAGTETLEPVRAVSAMGMQVLLSVYDSTRAVFGSFYGPVWIILFIVMLMSIKRQFRNFGWIFFVFLSAGAVSIFLSIAAVSDFVNSTERYMLGLFPTAYYWVMSNSIGKNINI